MVHSLLKTERMLKEFYVEAVDCAVYLLIVVPLEVLKVRHHEKRSKLDDKSEKYVFIGNDSRSKVYKHYNPSNGKIIISRDVTFDKESAWEWNSPQENYNTFLFLNREEQEDEDMEKVISPSSSPQIFTHEQDSPISSKSPPGHTRSLHDICEETEEINQRISDLTLFCLVGESEPLTFEEAAKEKKGKNAMGEEIQSIEKNNTWELTIFPKDQKSIGVKWVYKGKKNARGEVERYKARLVAKGYNQRHGIEYDEIFAFIARLKLLD
ncbi:hypothetical protein RJ639_044140 [Escallonia herrerae]|uniref:Reverse transcriptase Ty1/copia-type domain-containing protein n=1 Tax=Escallonia herrerae TaxID=1293975 RepID=A0AA88WE91_9ASTE|nr:hypothetical protein RJ639_044140 [Escallonia herrerae]